MVEATNQVAQTGDVTAHAEIRALGRTILRCATFGDLRCHA